MGKNRQGEGLYDKQLKAGKGRPYCRRCGGFVGILLDQGLSMWHAWTSTSHPSNHPVRYKIISILQRRKGSER